MHVKLVVSTHVFNGEMSFCLIIVVHVAPSMHDRVQLYHMRCKCIHLHGIRGALCRPFA